MSIDPNSSYYDAGGIEQMAINKAKSTPEQFEGYLLITTMTYLGRYNFKHKKKAERIRDLEKARINLDLLINELKGGVE